MIWEGTRCSQKVSDQPLLRRFSNFSKLGMDGGMNIDPNMIFKTFFGGQGSSYLSH